MKTRLFALAALAFALAACTSDYEGLDTDGPVAARFAADIGNVPFILKNGKFEAEEKVIYIEDVKTHTFRAYYPYNAAGASSQPQPMPRRSRTSLPSTSSLLQEPRETKTVLW